MSMWAQGFEPRQDQANCGPGTKNCGKICIAQESECHIGKGRRGTAQVLAGAAMTAYGVHQAMQGNGAVGTALAMGGLATGLRGHYNIGRSMGHSTTAGRVGKAAGAVGLMSTNPLLYAAGLVSNVRGQEAARQSVRPALRTQEVAATVKNGGIPEVGANQLAAMAAQFEKERAEEEAFHKRQSYPVGKPFEPLPGQRYTAMTMEEYRTIRKREGVNAPKPLGVDEWGTVILPFGARNQQPRVNPSMNASSIYSNAEHEAAMQELAQRKAKYEETNRRQMARLENLRNGTVKPRLMDRHGRIEPAAIRQQRTLNAVRKLRKRSAA